MRGGVPLTPRALDLLAERHGGEIRNGGRGLVRRIAPIGRAGAGDLAPFFNARYLPEAREALARGASLLIDDTLDVPETKDLAGWFHPFAAWTLAELLELGDAPAHEPYIGTDVKIGMGAILLPRVHIGNRVTIAAGAVIGAPGFGFTPGPDGKIREVPQLGGVVIEDDVHIGACCTIAAGTIAPTYIRRGVKLDAQVHIGHNCDVGEGTIIAAQSGLAGSVVVGKNVMMGGQVGIADHITIGDGVKIAAKSGVIGDVAAGETVAGYPAVQRTRWLRGLAAMYRSSERSDAT